MEPTTCDYCEDDFDTKELNSEMLCESCAKYYCYDCNYSPCACKELSCLTCDKLPCACKELERN